MPSCRFLESPSPSCPLYYEITDPAFTAYDSDYEVPTTVSPRCVGRMDSRNSDPGTAERIGVEGIVSCSTRMEGKLFQCWLRGLSPQTQEAMARASSARCWRNRRVSYDGVHLEPSGHGGTSCTAHQWHVTDYMFLGAGRGSGLILALNEKGADRHDSAPADRIQLIRLTFGSHWSRASLQSWRRVCTMVRLTHRCPLQKHTTHDSRLILSVC